MKSFEKHHLGKDGTFIDFCKWYGGDCGDCFKRINGLPPCYEAHSYPKRDTMPKQTIMLDLYKDGIKVGELDITDMPIKQIEIELELQEYQGRTWSYRYKGRNF